MALRYGKIAIPGVMTPTEMITAVEWGADAVKLFPAGHFGAKYIKDIKGPFPHIPIIPTGGVNLENIGSFIFCRREDPILKDCAGLTEEQGGDESPSDKGWQSIQFNCPTCSQSF